MSLCQRPVTVRAKGRKALLANGLLLGSAFATAGCQHLAAPHPPAALRTTLPAPASSHASVESSAGRHRNSSASTSGTIVQVSAIDEPPADEFVPPKSVPKPKARFDVPADLPGSSTPALSLPPFNPDDSIEKRRSAIEKLYAELPKLPDEQSLLPGSSTEKVALASLEQMACEYSPALRQAEADVEAARGKAVQVGLYPNPTVGYQSDTVGTSDTAGYHGAFFSQEFVTKGKLTLAQQAAIADLNKSEFELRKARITLVSTVRRNYFAVLIAQQKVRFAKALSQLSDEMYRAQIELVAGGESAAYEPVQLRVLALQARNDVVRAQNDYISAWRAMTATLGVPDMQPTGLEGIVDRAAPELNYDLARAWLESTHSDLCVAQAELSGASSNLNLQRVTPYPNITVTGVVQRDYTAPQLDSMSYNLQVGFPLPVFDRNQGNIYSAEAGVMKAQQAWSKSRNKLLTDLADTFRSYNTARQLAEVYRTDLLPSQVQAYRGVYDRFRNGSGDIDFAQVVVTQQTLAQVVGEYLRVLNDQWLAAVAMAETLQFDDLHAMEQQLAQPGALP